MRGNRSSLAAALAALAALACASGSGAPPRPPAPAGPAAAAPAPAAPPTPEATAPGSRSFPSPGELDRLSRGPAPRTIFAMGVEPVERWRLEGPFPERVAVEPWAQSTPWGALLEDAARRRAGLVVPTEAMHCVAREHGRFYLEHRSQPGESLKRFITARCHASAARVALAWVNGDLPHDPSEAQVYRDWKEAVMRTLDEGLAGGPRTAGIWYGRQGGHGVVMVAVGLRTVHLEPLSPVVGRDGRFELRGESLLPVAGVQVLVNRGRFGVGRCEALDDATLPRFHFRCQVDRDDPAAFVSLSLQEPDRLLLTTGATLLVWPGRGTVDVYERPRFGQPRPVEPDVDPVPDLVDLVNRARREAGLSALVLDPEQSREAAELAPHFFAATFGREPSMVSDLVVLGLMAGWNVDGVVQSGHFTAAWVMQSGDLSELLGAALEYPSGRAALLADDAGRIAVGALVERTGGQRSLAAVFGTYALFSASEHEAMAERVYRRLEQERARRGRRPPERLDALAGPCLTAAGRVGGGQDPRDAMGLLLRQSGEALRRPVAGWVAEVRDIDALEFPEQYLEEPDLAVAVAVTHRRPTGEPWGHYVLLLVVAAPEGRGA